MPNELAILRRLQDEERNHFSSSLARGLAVLSAFSAEKSLWSLSELAAHLGMNRSTAYRYMSTLEKLGYLEQDSQTKQYRLGLRVVDLGLAALNSMGISQIARPYLEELSKRTGHTVNMVALDDTDIVYLERVVKGIDLNLSVGSRLPAYCTSAGKALFAYLSLDRLQYLLDRVQLLPRGPNTITNRRQLQSELEQVRERGFAVNNEELAYGLRSIAAPVRSQRGEVVAAVNIAAHASMTSLDDLVKRLAPRLLETTRAISAQLGYRADDAEETP